MDDWDEDQKQVNIEGTQEEEEDTDDGIEDDSNPVPPMITFIPGTPPFEQAEVESPYLQRGLKRHRPMMASNAEDTMQMAPTQLFADAVPVLPESKVEGGQTNNQSTVIRQLQEYATEMREELVRLMRVIDESRERTSALEDEITKYRRDRTRLHRALATRREQLATLKSGYDDMWKEATHRNQIMYENLHACNDLLDQQQSEMKAWQMEAETRREQIEQMQDEIQSLKAIVRAMSSGDQGSVFMARSAAVQQK